MVEHPHPPSGLGMMVSTVQSWMTLAEEEHSTLGSRALLLLATLAVLGASYFVYSHHCCSTFQLDTRRTPRSRAGLGSSKDRGLGEWESVKFAYPAFEPCEKELADIAPMENRYWKDGPHHTTMGLRNMPWDQWIEVDNQYERYHRIRKRRIQTRGEKGIRVLSDAHNLLVKAGFSALAAVELVHEVAEYLTRKYPRTFRVLSRHAAGTLLRRPVTGEGGSRDSKNLSEAGQEPLDLNEYSDWGWEGEPPIRTIRVEATGETFELPLNARDGEKAPERALKIAALLTQDDLAIMIEGEDGKYYFQAGAILVPGFWRMEDKIGLPLEQIHISGEVPFYREKLERSMARFFRRLAVDKPVIRSNYFVQVVGEGRDAVDPEELAWGVTTNGPEDEPGERPEGGVEIERVLVRTERQTLRRLGVSGAVVFTIRTYTERMQGLGETEAGRRLGRAMGSWPGEVRRYKGADRWWGVVAGYLLG